MGAGCVYINSALVTVFQPLCDFNVILMSMTTLRFNRMGGIRFMWSVSLPGDSNLFRHMQFEQERFSAGRNTTNNFVCNLKSD